MFCQINLAFQQRKKFPMRIVTTQHGYPNGNLRSRIVHAMAHLLKMCFDRVIVVSQELKQQNPLYQLNPRCIVIPNVTLPHDNNHKQMDDCNNEILKNFFLKKSSGLVIGWLGRMEQVKGPLLFLQAIKIYWEKYIKAYPELKLTVLMVVMEVYCIPPAAEEQKSVLAKLSSDALPWRNSRTEVFSIA
jgi:glycosyltransferase involved in cell wall biosynthesis